MRSPSREGRPPFSQAGSQAARQAGRQDFRHLLHFRITVRRFLRWSEAQAAEAGLTPTQHQFLMAIKGRPGARPPSIRELAEYLLLQSHSTVGLAERAEASGIVRRSLGPDEARVARVARVELTEKGDKLVTELATAHLARLYGLAAALNALLLRRTTASPDSRRFTDTQYQASHYPRLYRDTILM